MATPELVSTNWLQENLYNLSVRVVDTRWALGHPGEGRRHYDQGHISGAVHLDVDEHLSAKEGPGRHPIPRRYDFQKLMSEIGIRRETHVVVYDDGKGVPAARLWWLLRYYGHDQVSVLDGGWALWKKEGRPASHEIPQFNSTDFVGRPRRKWMVDKEGVDGVRDNPETLLIDARSPERYRGEVEPIDPRPGHIPGALNFFYANTLDPESGKFLPPEKLREEFEKVGADQAKTIICYCGSGVSACTNILALSLAGFDAQLYEGSWSEWSKDMSLPATTGLL